MRARIHRLVLPLMVLGGMASSGTLKPNKPSVVKLGSFAGLEIFESWTCVNTRSRQALPSQYSHRRFGEASIGWAGGVNAIASRTWAPGLEKASSHAI